MHGGKRWVKKLQIPSSISPKTRDDQRIGNRILVEDQFPLLPPVGRATILANANQIRPFCFKNTVCGFLLRGESLLLRVCRNGTAEPGKSSQVEPGLVG